VSNLRSKGVDNNYEKGKDILVSSNRIENEGEKKKKKRKGKSNIVNPFPILSFQLPVIPSYLSDTISSPRVYPTSQPIRSSPNQFQIRQESKDKPDDLNRRWSPRTPSNDRGPIRELARNVQLADADIGIVPDDFGEAAGLVCAFGFVAAEDAVGVDSSGDGGGGRAFQASDWGGRGAGETGTSLGGVREVCAAVGGMCCGERRVVDAAGEACARGGCFEGGVDAVEWRAGGVPRRSGNWGDERSGLGARGGGSAGRSIDGRRVGSNISIRGGGLLHLLGFRLAVLVVVVVSRGTSDSSSYTGSSGSDPICVLVLGRINRGRLLVGGRGLLVGGRGLLLVCGCGLLVGGRWLLLVGRHRWLRGRRWLLIGGRGLLSKILLARKEHGKIHRRSLLSLVRRRVAHVARLVLIIRGRGNGTRRQGTRNGRAVRSNAFQTVRVVATARVLGVARRERRRDGSGTSVDGVAVVRAVVTRNRSSRAESTRDVQIRRESSACRHR
jgi:hypothetical protein